MNIFRELGVEMGEDRIDEEVIYNIAKVYTLVSNTLAVVLSRHNLSLAKFNILLMAKHVGRDKGISQHKLSELLLVTTSNTTRMIDKLEKEGYVARTSKTGDRRVRLIKITREGSDLLDKVWPDYKKKIEELVGSNLSKAEKEKINEILEKLKETAK